MYIDKISSNLERISKFEQKTVEITDRKFKSWNLVKAIIRGGE